MSLRSRLLAPSVAFSLLFACGKKDDDEAPSDVAPKKTNEVLLDQPSPSDPSSSNKKPCELMWDSMKANKTKGTVFEYEDVSETKTPTGESIKNTVLSKESVLESSDTIIKLEMSTQIANRPAHTQIIIYEKDKMIAQCQKTMDHIKDFPPSNETASPLITKLSNQVISVRAGTFTTEYMKIETTIKQHSGESKTILETWMMGDPKNPIPVKSKTAVETHFNNQIVHSLSERELIRYTKGS